MQFYAIRCTYDRNVYLVFLQKPNIKNSWAISLSIETEVFRKVKYYKAKLKNLKNRPNNHGSCHRLRSVCVDLLFESYQWIETRPNSCLPACLPRIFTLKIYRTSRVRSGT